MHFRLPLQTEHELSVAGTLPPDTHALMDAVFSGSDDCIKILDLDGRLQFMSEGGQRVMEVDDFSLLKGKPWPDFWSGDGNGAAHHAIAEARAGRKTRFLGHADTAKGSSRYWDVQVMPVLGPDGEPTHLLSISRDISETRLAQATVAKLVEEAKVAAAAEADSLRRLLKDAPSFMCVLQGPEHVYQITNDAYLQLVGHRNLIGLTVREALPEVAGQVFYELLDTVYCTAKAFVGRGLAIDVQRTVGGPIETAYLNLVCQPILDENGEVSGIFVEGSDVTDLKMAEIALTESRMRLSIALDAAGMGVWESTLSNGTFINIKEDDRAGRILARPLSTDPIYENFVSRVHPQDRRFLAEATRQALDPEGDGILDVEYRIRAQPGYPEHWVHARAKAVREGEATRFVGTVRDVTVRKNAEAQQKLLAGELQHRIKNTFAMVSAIASQTLRGSDIAEQRETFNARIHTLGQAHDLLLGTRQEQGYIRDVIETALAPHRSAADQFQLSGPDFPLSPKQTLSLALAVHELATNSVKYGALSNGSGRVDVIWSNARNPSGDMFSFKWQESGGPPVSEPTRKGFGSRLIARVFASDFGGDVHIDYAPTGVVCTLTSKIAVAVPEAGAMVS